LYYSLKTESLISNLFIKNKYYDKQKQKIIAVASSKSPSPSLNNLTQIVLYEGAPTIEYYKTRTRRLENIFPLEDGGFFLTSSGEKINILSEDNQTYDSSLLENLSYEKNRVFFLAENKLWAYLEKLSVFCEVRNLSEELFSFINDDMLLIYVNQLNQNKNPEQLDSFDLIKKNYINNLLLKKQDFSLMSKNQTENENQKEKAMNTKLDRTMTREILNSSEVVDKIQFSVDNVGGVPSISASTNTVEELSKMLPKDKVIVYYTAQLKSSYNIPLNPPERVVGSFLSDEEKMWVQEFISELNHTSLKSLPVGAVFKNTYYLGLSKEPDIVEMDNQKINSTAHVSFYLMIVDKKPDSKPSIKDVALELEKNLYVNGFRKMQPKNVILRSRQLKLVKPSNTVPLVHTGGSLMGGSYTKNSTQVNAESFIFALSGTFSNSYRNDGSIRIPLTTVDLKDFTPDSTSTLSTDVMNFVSTLSNKIETKSGLTLQLVIESTRNQSSPFYMFVTDVRPAGFPLKKYLKNKPLSNTKIRTKEADNNDQLLFLNDETNIE
jgi:hypothetical protein